MNAESTRSQNAPVLLPVIVVLLVLVVAHFLSTGLVVILVDRAYVSNSFYEAYAFPWRWIASQSPMLNAIWKSWVYNWVMFSGNFAY